MDRCGDEQLPAARIAHAASEQIAAADLSPTVNWASPDPQLSWLDPVPNQAKSAPVRVAQNNGFAFGGNSCIVMFGACPWLAW